MTKVRVLIVDDSALIRQFISVALSATSDLEVVGEAVDPHDAREKIKELNPDVITLDVEMPKMDGISFLANLMRLRPMPVVMVSTLTAKASVVTLNALELGAVDFVEKPNAGLSGDMSEFTREVQDKVRMASKANVTQLQNSPKRVNKHSAPIAANSSRYSILSLWELQLVGLRRLRTCFHPTPPVDRLSLWHNTFRRILVRPLRSE